MREIWPIIINQMNEDFKSETYHTVFHGVNLFNNLARIKESNPRLLGKRKRKIATFFVLNPDNMLIHKSRRGESTASAGNWLYPRNVLHPVEVGDKRTRGTSLVLKNPRSIYQHHDIVLRQILKWLKSGALEWISEDRIKSEEIKPLLTSSIIVVPKSGPEQFRVCFNGNPVKLIEKNKQACTLDSLASALSFLKQGDLLTKVDDKSGFHQMVLDPFSRNMAFCEYGGQKFRYRAAAFGFPKIPGTYQMVNGAPLNYLRKASHMAFLYLDDRLFVCRPSIRKKQRHGSRVKKHRQDLF
jgi:hypothetical protein